MEQIAGATDSPLAVFAQVRRASCEPYHTIFAVALALAVMRGTRCRRRRCHSSVAGGPATW